MLRFLKLQGSRFGDLLRRCRNGPRIVSQRYFDSGQGLRTVIRSAPGPEDSQIWSAIDGCVDDAVLLSHIFVLGYVFLW